MKFKMRFIKAEMRERERWFIPGKIIYLLLLKSRRNYQYNTARYTLKVQRSMIGSSWAPFPWLDSISLCGCGTALRSHCCCAFQCLASSFPVLSTTILKTAGGLYMTNIVLYMANIICTTTHRGLAYCFYSPSLETSRFCGKLRNKLKAFVVILSRI